MKILLIALAVFVAVGATSLIFKLLSGAVGIIAGAINAVLGLAVIVALILIVVWMFSYARRNK